MADTKVTRSSTTALTLHSSLNSLASGGANASLTAAVDDTTARSVNGLVRVKLVGSASTTTSCLIYLVGGFADDVYTDELAPGGSGAQIAVVDLDNSPLLGTMQMEGTSPYVSTGMFPLARPFGGLVPPKWAVAVRNESGGALAASGHAIDVVTYTFTTV